VSASLIIILSMRATADRDDDSYSQDANMYSASENNMALLENQHRRSPISSQDSGNN